MIPTVYIVVAADGKTAKMRCRDERYRAKGAVTGEATRENLIYDMCQVYERKGLPAPRMTVLRIVEGGRGEEEKVAS